MNRIENLNKLLEYHNSNPNHKSIEDIISEFEKAKPRECILIQYKDFGDFIFTFKRMVGRVIIYEFTGTVS